MATALIPEFEVLNVVQLALDFIRKDYDAQLEPENSYLVRLLQGDGLKRYDFVTEAKKIFLADIDDPRYLEAHLMFNFERAGAPTIHIVLPSEQTAEQNNGIGLDEGYDDYIFDDEQDPTTYTATFTREFQSNYSIVITSENTNEVILIYHVLRALLISLTQHLGLKGIRGIKLGGHDLSVNDKSFPQNIFFRAINMSLQYETSCPDVVNHPIFKTITAKGTPINN